MCKSEQYAVANVKGCCSPLHKSPSPDLPGFEGLKPGKLLLCLLDELINVDGGLTCRLTHVATRRELSATLWAVLRH